MLCRIVAQVIVLLNFLAHASKLQQEVDYDYQKCTNEQLYAFFDWGSQYAVD